MNKFRKPNAVQVEFTVMATPEDLRANAEYIRMADNFVAVPGGSNNNNYANVRLIVETAESVEADAVWAGWGHASENPALPTALLSASRPIAFIGPPAGPMYALGDKIGSTIIAQSAGVPTIAWNGCDLKVDYKREGLPDSVYALANLKTEKEAVEAAEKVGFPLMVKASEGGGGKGIRKVLDSAALPAAFRQVQAEVPGSPIFLMRLAPQSRHLEVQLLADAYGEAIALYGRDCSVQRRHQKIIEEGPVLAADPGTWTAMERAAVRLAKEVGYVNAGTVEYLWLEEDGSFAFLELNPRLQVEHPVTEMISGVNLPAAQLNVAMGVRLAHIPDIRRLYGKTPLLSSDPQTDTSIDFENTERLPPRGHVIAARITAENPDSGFQPTSGTITELNFRSTPNVWGYFSVDSSGRVHEFADSQFGHLFSFAPCREDARRHLVMALRELSIRGDIRTTVEYLAHMLEEPDFRSNAINTSWLDTRIGAKVRTAKPDSLLTAMLGAVCRAHATFSKRTHDYVGHLERGQYPPPSLTSVDDNVELIYDSVKYSLHTSLSGPSTVTLACNGSWVQADFHPLADGGLLVSMGGRAHLVYAKEESGGLRLVLDGATCQFTNEYDPTALRAPMSGKLARYLVEDGSSLKAGTPYVEVEVMKMYMALSIPESGTLSLIKPEGSLLEPGDLIATCALEDPSKVHRAEPYTGTLPQPQNSSNSVVSATQISSRPPLAPSHYAKRWHHVARGAMKTLSALMTGYEAPRDVFDAALFDRDVSFSSPELAQLEVEEVLSVLSSRIPAILSQKLASLVDEHRKFSQTSGGELDVTPLVEAVDLHANGLGEKERLAFTTLIKPLRDVLEKFKAGVAGAGRASLFALLQQYLSVERLFSDGRRPEDIVSDLRTAAGTEKDALVRVFETIRAHAQLKQRNVLVLAVLSRIAEALELEKKSTGHGGRLTLRSQSGGGVIAGSGGEVSDDNSTSDPSSQRPSLAINTSLFYNVSSSSRSHSMISEEMSDVDNQSPPRTTVGGDEGSIDDEDTLDLVRPGSRGKSGNPWGSVGVGSKKPPPPAL